MKTEIQARIEQLKQQKNAVILAHYYVSDEVQSLADYVGDSFYLAKIASTTTADVLVFCGVSFMGESAKILNPGKTVLMPDKSADCPMAHMVAPGRIDELRARYPDLAVVCYINSTAELKSMSDVCVTSSNALKIVKRLPQKNIFFIPDQNLGRYVAEQLPEKNVILNDGCCPVHAVVTAHRLLQMKSAHPNALVLTHPECREEVVALSDFVGSTAEILSFATKSEGEEFIICTEMGIAYPLQMQNPNKQFFFVTDDFCCADMKLNTPEKILQVLKTEENEVVLDENLCASAMRPLNRMLELAQ